MSISAETGDESGIACEVVNIVTSGSYGKILYCVRNISMLFCFILQFVYASSFYCHRIMWFIDRVTKM